MKPDLIATGKFRIMSQIKDEVDALGLPSSPFLLWVVSDKYAAAHPDNAKAFLAAYRDAVEILKTDDDAWVAHAKELGVPDDAIPALRQPQHEAEIRKTFWA